jgi:drug/metabolite transporter (DMT)-like permease
MFSYNEIQSFNESELLVHNYVIEATSAQTTSLILFFKPILAPILALVLLHEVIPFNMIIGILCILLGSLSSILPGLLT